MTKSQCVLNVYPTKALRALFKDACEANGESMNAVLIEAMTRYVRKKAKPKKIERKVDFVVPIERGGHGPRPTKRKK